MFFVFFDCVDCSVYGGVFRYLGLVYSSGPAATLLRCLLVFGCVFWLCFVAVRN